MALTTDTTEKRKAEEFHRLEWHRAGPKSKEGNKIGDETQHQVFQDFDLTDCDPLCVCCSLDEYRQSGIQGEVTTGLLQLHRW